MVQLSGECSAKIINFPLIIHKILQNFYVGCICTPVGAEFFDLDVSARRVNDHVPTI